ncbi:hypothetical protein DEAC_c23040 [Desulfosporosinus acididurans]|uniref:Shedu protein SduA C-terminal domain-containing protein n=1 Tax=Desulfosporosinus acididurans TaxID=476652 RepID=A0A0J1FQB2_9FIRM|nr:Shedu anti-phage system protein SduA domain-containing protein [Desulfosporosinus acididurans]KLU65674.1 hypothetical protein DEAC_c23040 [Desulfosporosinus acididurans]
MMITDAVFQELTEEELELYEEYKVKSSKIHRAGLIYNYPDKVRFCTELFPGNYLDEKVLKRRDELTEMCNQFLSLLNNTQTGERDILNFIRDRRAYHLIGSIQKKNYNFGHHGTCVFPEFQLGSSYQADYLILGKNSDGYHFVFIELESPYGKISIGSGHEGEVIRKGINQIDDWDRWLDGNFSSLAEIFEKNKHPHFDLPKEFYKFDKTRVEFVVIAGRRKDFNENLRWKKRKLAEDKKIVLMHYDNLYDYAIEAIGANTY